jgi:hypothetical protein
MVLGEFKIKKGGTFREILAILRDSTRFYEILWDSTGFCEILKILQDSEDSMRFWGFWRDSNQGIRGFERVASPSLSIYRGYESTTDLARQVDQKWPPKSSNKGYRSRARDTARTREFE